MKAIDAIRTALIMSDRWVRKLEEMKDAPLARADSKTGNHCMWVLGHVTVVEGRLHKALFGTPNPVENWKPMFDAGSEPVDDPAAYPPYDEVLRKYRELRAKTLAYVETLGDDDLDRPIEHPPPGLEAAFGTVGKALLTTALHQAFHNGQSSVARRATGKQPVFVPTNEFRES